MAPEPEQKAKKNSKETVGNTRKVSNQQKSTVGKVQNSQNTEQQKH